MPQPTRCRWPYLIRLALVLVLLTSGTGCVGLVANLIYAGIGDKIPARYAGLTEKRVAVLCVSHSSLFGPSSAATEIATRIHARLAKNVPKISLVDQQAIDDWIDRNGWDEVDYRQVGAGVDAQMVVGIDILSFSIHEGTTLYKGRCDVEVTVFNMDADGKSVFNEVLPQIQFPIIAGQHITDTTESAFRKQFIGVVAEHIARNFYDYDRVDDFGRDTIAMEF